MSIYNLTNQAISSSFEPLLQIDSGSALRDGTGSIVDNINLTSSFAITASFALNAGEVQTGSLLTTASFDNGTRDLTFTKGDSSTFLVNIPGGSIDTGSFATTGSNTFIGNQVITGSLFLSSSEQGSRGGVVFQVSDVGGPGSKNGVHIDGRLSVEGPVDFQTLSIGSLFADNLYSSTGGPNALIQVRTNMLLVEDGPTPVNITITGSAFVSSSVNIGEKLNLTPNNPLPAGVVGDLATSGSELYFNDGTNWSPISEQINTSSFATTGSNNFFGNQNISGSVESTINLSNTHLNPQTITDNVIIPTGLNGVIIGETTIVGDYTIEGNSEVYVFTPPPAIDTGSFATTGSNNFIGDQTITGSLNVKEIINLEPQDPLPTGLVGDLATSGSALYFNDGVNWRTVNLT